MPPFKIIDEEGTGKFYTIKGVPIFEMHTNRGFPCNTEWMKAAISNHAKHKQYGYRPTVIVGHNVRGQEKEAVGFLDKLVLKGKRLYADICRIPAAVKDKIVQNAYPNRSVEVLPKSKRILCMALLGGTTPHFTLPQMVYKQDEESKWYRSPDMFEFSEEQNAALVKTIGAAISNALPEAIAQYAAVDGNGDEDDESMLSFVDPDTGEQYAIPKALAKGLSLAGRGIGKIGGKGAQKGFGHAAGKVIGTVAKHPAASAAAGGVTLGIAAGRKSKRGNQYELDEAYTIDDETGEIYLGEEAVGVAVSYAELEELEGGMTVPTAPKKPHALPDFGGDDPNLQINEGDVGVGTGDTGGAGAPGMPAGDNVQPLARGDSDQFAEEVDAELYELQQEVHDLKIANSLITAGRQAEDYRTFLETQRAAGAPVGDIDKTVDFMMSMQTAEQVNEYKALIESQPKVAFQKAVDEEPETFELSVARVKQDFNSNRETYEALGVKEADLKYADHVRGNIGVD